MYEPMHYAKDAADACARQPVCDPSSMPNRITTAKKIVSCPDCRAWLGEPEEEMPKDAKTTVEDLRRTASELLARAAEIEREEVKNNPPEPPRGAGKYFRVIVQFTPGGKMYTYLLLRIEHGGRWFTTGTHEDQKMFTDWRAFLAWLNGPDVYSHSSVVRLNDPTDVWGSNYTGPNRFESGPKFK